MKAINWVKEQWNKPGYLRKIAIVWVALMFIGFILPREKDLSKAYIGVFKATVEPYESKIEGSNSFITPKTYMTIELLQYSIKVIDRTDSDTFESKGTFILGRRHFDNDGNISFDVTLKSDAYGGSSWEELSITIRTKLFPDRRKLV